jgi:Spherulation-specific family 4
VPGTRLAQAGDQPFRPLAGPDCGMIPPGTVLAGASFAMGERWGDGGMALAAADLGNGRRRRRRLATGLAIVAGLAAIGAPALIPAAADALAVPGPFAAATAPAACQRTFVPAYPWSASFWTRAIDSKPAPGVMILNVTGMGAGTTPVPHFQALVRKARAAGITVLGYSSTEYGARPAAQVEADARDYKAWYKVNGMFLDLTANAASGLPYYRKLAAYIRAENPGSVIWLNVGAYPARGYMSVGNVVVAFEGSYASYLGLQVPGWVAHYKRTRFADVIYATPRPDLASVVRLSRHRRTGYLYATNLPGSPDPYTALPGYWASEVASVAAPC